MGINWDKLKDDWNALKEKSKELEEDEKSEKKDYSDLLSFDEDEKDDKKVSEKKTDQEYEIKRLEARVDFLEETVKDLITLIEEERNS